jgi:hypothetical protein
MFMKICGSENDAVPLSKILTVKTMATIILDYDARNANAQKNIGLYPFYGLFQGEETKNKSGKGF